VQLQSSADKLAATFAPQAFADRLAPFVARRIWAVTKTWTGAAASPRERRRDIRQESKDE
jgi:hypothetical protein